MAQASVARKRYGQTLARVFCPGGEGVVVVCDPQTRSGGEFGVVFDRVRGDDDVKVSAGRYFPIMPGYLTSRP